MVMRLMFISFSARRISSMGQMEPAMMPLRSVDLQRTGRSGTHG